MRMLLAFYGDDFTGTASTAEALTVAGVPTIIFTQPPAASFLSSHFPQVRAVGVAGTARTVSAEDLEAVLSPVFEVMKVYQAPVFLYKVCSTFDSSSQVGSIGRAIEIGRSAFSPDVVPVLPAAPKLGRFTAFGHHFAALGQEEVYRLDRHLSMADHPVTPMRESDLRTHLAEQTALKSGLIDVLALDRGKDHVQAMLDGAIAESVPIVFFDCLHEQHLRLVCEVIWQRAGPEKPVFFVGSHELGSGFGDVWQKANLLPPKPAGGETRPASDKGPLLVVSGSCATVTGEQIQWAVENGFAEVEIGPQKLLDPAGRSLEQGRIVEVALSALGRGVSVIAHTSAGLDDPRIRWMREKASELSLAYEAANDLLGDALGEITRTILLGSNLKRLVVAGGDTSGRIQAHLDIQALQVARSSGIGAPLCYVYSDLPGVNGLEVVFKGGQVGGVDYFSTVQAARTIDFESAALGRF